MVTKLAISIFVLLETETTKCVFHSKILKIILVLSDRCRG